MAFNLSAFAGAGAQFFNDSGVPLSGGLLYSYAAGTTTPATTWTTNSGAVANTNPIVLDSAGRTPNEIWVTGGVNYKFILKTSAGVTIGTYDDIPSLNDVSGFNNLITVTGTNSLIGTSVPPYTTYTAGMTLSFVPVAANTGAVTLDLDGLGAKNITFDASTALTSGTLAIGQIVTLQYDGTRFQMLNGVTTNEIADGAVTAAKLATDSVTTIKITDLNVTTGKLADNAVTTLKITNANVTPAKLSQPFTAGTAVASTSGTSIDFTSIPSWVKRITLMLSAVSTSGTSLLRVQIGGGSLTTSGYVGCTSAIVSGTAGSNSFAGGGWDFNDGAGSALASRTGIITIANITSNTWVMQGMYSDPVSSSRSVFGSGSVPIAATLDRLRVTTVNGTDTFDAGTINILYEG